MELDDYNWFYTFDPFAKEVYEKVIDNICESLNRVRRKVHLISILPRYNKKIMETGKFVLTNQFDIMMRQRVVNIYVTK